MELVVGVVYHGSRAIESPFGDGEHEERVDVEGVIDDHLEVRVVVEDIVRKFDPDGGCLLFGCRGALRNGRMVSQEAVRPGVVQLAGDGVSRVIWLLTRTRDSSGSG